MCRVEVAILDLMKKDLLATQRYQNIYDDGEYPELDDSRVLLLDHLRQIQRKLSEAMSVSDMVGAREQLLAFSQVAGDRAFFGFFGEQLTTPRPTAGVYPISVTIDGTSYSGMVTVRNDPLAEN